MIFERTLVALAAAAAIVAAAATSVIAAAFALFALLRPEVGPAGAAAIVAGTFAFIVGLAGVFAALRGASSRRHPEPDQASLIQTVMELAKGKPLMAAGIALAAGVLVVRNPQFVGAILRAFVDSQPNPRR